MLDLGMCAHQDHQSRLHIQLETCVAWGGFPEVGRKDDQDKPRWDLIPFKGLEEIAKVLTFGAKKYAPDNWRRVNGWRWRYLRAAIGHIAAAASGEELDPESGLSHLAHAGCCILFLIELGA